ncbi:endospore germination permease [Paenibacillus provencensis]|uniref:Endospore germination permease n=1 Tax=Paenibacillus provencensis TaxID=441151 RepID=A0ABW3Q0L3_9BACL|nr:endospore germination permease [Paenibacillus sp. MER 78]MCM3129501.1 endospore germination permease [Paenibacillus sp. MER 78]
MYPVKPSFLQAAMLIMLSVGLSNHVFIIPVLLQVAGRDSWLSVLVSSLPITLFILVVFLISKQLKTNTLAEWISNNLGKAGGFLFKLVSSVYFLQVSYFTFYDTAMWAKSSYLMESPMFVIGLILAFLSVFTACLGMRTLAFASGILLPLVVIFGFYVATVNMQYKDYNRLLPLFEHGYTPMFTGVFYCLAGWFEIALILFIQPYLASKFKLWQLLLLLFIMIGLTAGPLTGAITEFGPNEAEHMRYPAFEEWRIASLGKYITQTDFFSIYQWLAGSFTRISLAMYIAIVVWDIKKKRNLIFIILGVLMSISLIYPMNDSLFQNLLITLIFPVNFAYFSFLIIIALMAILIGKLRKKRRGNNAAVRGNSSS